MLDLPFFLTIITTGVSTTWFISRQIHQIHLDIDAVNDELRQYQILNDTKVIKERDRITALKINSRAVIEHLNARLTDMEDFLVKHHGFKLRSYRNHIYDAGTQGDYHDDNDTWTEIN